MGAGSGLRLGHAYCRLPDAQGRNGAVNKDYENLADALLAFEPATTRGAPIRSRN